MLQAAEYSQFGHQLIRNLSEQPEFAMIYLDFLIEGCASLADDSGTRTLKTNGRYVEVHGPYKVMLNVDSICTCTKTYVTIDSDQKEQIYLNQKS